MKKVGAVVVPLSGKIQACAKAYRKARLQLRGLSWKARCKVRNDVVQRRDPLESEGILWKATSAAAECGASQTACW
jgi:hypothetical protein